MTKTINGLTVTTSAAASDFLAIWRAANSDTRKITKANFMGGVLTGAGTIATGGFTGTLPATGTFSLLGTAQTYTALKTYSAGIRFGNETLNVYDEGTWSPTITASSSNPTVAYTFQVGLYTQIGNVVFYSFYIHINTISGGSGDIRISLPVVVNSTTAGNGPAPARLDGVDVTNTLGAVFVPTTAQSYGIIRSITDNGSSTTEGLAALASGDVINVSGMYFTNP